MKRKVIQFFVLLMVFVCLLLVLQFTRYGGIAGYIIVSDSVQSDFDLGAYSNTIYNGSAVVLSGSNLAGSYTSRIFNFSLSSRWNNLSVSAGKQSIVKFFAASTDSDVWKSLDSGATWGKINDDYNGADGNGGTEMIINSSGGLIILHLQDVWSSGNSGLTWGKVNDDFNGAGISNGVVLARDSSGNLFIVDSVESVWKSTDFGATWSTVNSSNFNGASGNVFGIASDSGGNLFAVDVVSDVWKSTNSGVTWSKVNDDYNGAGSNGGNDLVSYGSDLFILDGQDLWKSADSGATWGKINDDFNGAGDSNSGIVLEVNSQGIYIADASEDVYYSGDAGATFSRLVADLNGAGLGVFALNSYNYTSGLSYQIRNCSVSDCSDGSWASANLSNLNLTGKYFQYRVNFSRTDLDVASSITGANVDYSKLNAPPSVSISSPENNAIFYYNNSIDVSYTASDSDNNLQSCWYKLDNGGNTLVPGCSTIYLNLSDGTHLIEVHANDSDGESGSASMSFRVLAIGIPLSLSEPAGGKTNRTNIPINYSVRGENLNCKYNVLFSTGAVAIDNTSIINCGNSSFAVAVDGDYIFNLYVNNSLGVSNSSSSSFSVDSDVSEETSENTTNSSDSTPTTTTSSGSKSGSGGNGGGSGLYVEKKKNESVVNNSNADSSSSSGSGASKFGITDYERTGNQLKISYNLSGGLEGAQAHYTLSDLDGVVAVQGDAVLSGGTLSLELPKNAFGEFTLEVSVVTTSGEQKFSKGIFLPSQGTTGLVALDSKSGGASIIGIILVSVIILFFVGRFLYRYHSRTSNQVKMFGGRKKFISVDLK